MMVDIGAYLGRPVTRRRASRSPGEPFFFPVGFPASRSRDRNSARVGWCDAI